MYPTPHIKATPEQFGKTVLMPGDPNRSRFIAENFLKDAVLVNNVRGVQGYTGFYKDTPVSVMASGMGMPSIGIYSHELFNAFDVDNIIRVGSAGSIQKDVKVMDVIIGMGACTDSNFGMQFRLPGTFAPIADFGLLSKCVEKAKALNMDNYHVGNVLSSDLFYEDNLNLPGYMQSVELWGKMGVLAFDTAAYNAEYDQLDLPGLKIRRGMEFGMTADNREQFKKICSAEILTLFWAPFIL